MGDFSDQKNIGGRLRSGEKIRCEECNEGYYITEAQDVSTSHCFRCNICNSHINIDDANVIVE